MLGGTAFITHLASVWPSQQLEMFEKMEKGDYTGALDMQVKATVPWYDFRLKAGAYTSGEAPPVKAALVMATTTRNRAILQLAGDVLGNVFTGYYEEVRPTSISREATRQKNQLEVINVILQHLVGPGDFFTSDERADFAAEAYTAWGSCKGCFAAKKNGIPPGVQFAEYNHDEIAHEYVTDSPFRDIAHAIVNHQQRLDQAFFHTVLERLENYHTNKMSPNHGYGTDEYKAMAIELATVAALCAGVKAFFAASGLPCPPLPEKLKACEPPNFRHVSDFSNGPLNTNTAIAWGPYLIGEQIKKEIAARSDFDVDTWMFATANNAPTSKASAAPLTCMDLLLFGHVMYFPAVDAVRFFKVPGEDRHLTRGQLEVAAAEYNRAKSCSY